MFHIFNFYRGVPEHVHEPDVSESDRSVVSFRPFSGDSRLVMLDDGDGVTVTVTVLLFLSLFLSVSPSANHPVAACKSI